MSFEANEKVHREMEQQDIDAFFERGGFVLMSDFVIGGAVVPIEAVHYVAECGRVREKGGTSNEAVNAVMRQIDVAHVAIQRKTLDNIA